MTLAITSLIALLQALIPSLGAIGATGPIIAALEAWLPLIIQEAPVMISTVQNIIAALEGSGQLTPEELAKVVAMKATADAAFDAAAAAADAEDAAAAPGT